MRQLAKGAAAATLTGLTTGTALAQPSAFPRRVVRLVWPYSAGGTGDQFARALAEALAGIWGKAVVVDNRPGAGGMIAADMVVKAEPDGHTLLMALTSVVQTPLLYGKAPYNPVRDLAAISELATIHQTLVVHPDLPATSMKGLAEYARKLGKPLPYGTVGLGSSSHLQMEVFGRNAKVALTHVPYKGEAPLMTDLLGGQVQVGLVAAVTARQHVRTGKLRPLAVGGMNRSSLLPDVPTFQEAGFSGMARTGWFGIFAPAATPPALVQKISADVNKALESPALRARMLEAGILLKGSTPAAFSEVVRRDQVYWGELIRSADVRLD
ncbi:twin-arginine translocation pathway signal protein [Cupriavidus basilensis OR16]|uniref:Twin-arginine translocation pathway signal protein n=1 Tax=Cupriavidus basilensis OR16 TaxID=1127483 RepID=H1S622_9BURK|nr:twin-arginine translocation pathway signal protein [Cupriavidus basilensis OR16]